MDIQGSGANDSLFGTDSADTITGLAGNDYLDGRGGADRLDGGPGDDIFVVDDAGDLVIEAAGEGSDLVYVTGGFWALGAGSHVETIASANQAGTLFQYLQGNDLGQKIIGNASGNILDGGGAGGADTFQGLAGDDVYRVHNSNDVIIEAAGEGADSIFTSASYTLAAGVSVEVLTTHFHSDYSAPLNLTGNEVTTRIFGNHSANLLAAAGTQGTNILGFDGNDTLLGAAGNDTLHGGEGADSMRGGGGNDEYIVDHAGDLVDETAGGGADVLFTGISYGVTGDVEVVSTRNQGGSEAIDLSGSGIAQTFYGNFGANLIDGGGGNDTLYGLQGADTFAFTTALRAGNVDTIADFTVGQDRIQLGGAAGQPFQALAAGALAAGSFVVGSAALQADDVILYNSATGALSYDADGNGAGAAIQFATLAPGLALTAADFTVSGPTNNPPVVQSGATASIAENSPTSAIVYQIVAADPDGDRLTYTLGGADASRLTIDASGAVRLINPADFETKATYSFTVIASDSGSSSAARPVTLTITNVAENVGTPTINETSAANDSVGLAQAIDRSLLAIGPNPDLPDDDLPSATIEGLLSSNGDKDFFSITLAAGELIILDVDGTTNSLDAFLRIYGPDGVEIGDNDDQVTFDPGSTPPFGHNTDSLIRFRPATDGTYTFSIESFEGTSSGAYKINVSIGPVASAAQIAAEDVAALVSGAAWDHLNLTYGFPNATTDYPTLFKEIDSASDNFEAFNAAQRAAVVQQYAMISRFTSLTFTERSDAPGQADLRYAMSDEPDVAYAFYPTNRGPTSAGGTAWFNNSAGRFDNPTLGNYSWMGILHETGHALGLKHGHEFPAISADRDSVENSVMTYRSYPGGSITSGYSNETFGYPQTLMMYDIAALQQMYGANFDTQAGNTIYSWSPTTGQMFINGVGQAAPGGNRVFMTLWDGGGIDTYDLSAYTTGTVIDLRPGEWSRTSSIQLANLGHGNVARGNVANALQYQDDPRSLIENAIGGNGSDRIIANHARNSLTGGGGGDSFAWYSVADAGLGAQADVVTDFTRFQDRIDLSAIDAIAGTPDNDVFTFIGSSAFSNIAGQLRFQTEGNSARIQGDVDGDSIPDFEILISNQPTLGPADFVL